MRAKTEKVKRGNGSRRKMCLSCNKVAYPNRPQAEQAAERVSKTIRPTLAYLSGCGWWHLTTEPRTAALRRKMQAYAEKAAG